MAKKLIPLPKTVKETVDFIYEYLAEHPEGVPITMSKLFDSKSQSRIVSILIKRGIVQKTYFSAPGKKGPSFSYKWVATMAPTKTLYGSIVAQIRNDDNNWPSRKKSAKSKHPTEEKPIIADNQPKVDDAKNISPDTIEPEYDLGFELEHSIGFADKPGLYAFPSESENIFVLTDAMGNVLAATYGNEIRQHQEPPIEVSGRYKGGIRCANEKEIIAFMNSLIYDCKLSEFVRIHPQQISRYADRELWDELKRRGYSIEGNRLVIIKKTYLD